MCPCVHEWVSTRCVTISICVQCLFSCGCMFSGKYCTYSPGMPGAWYLAGVGCSCSVFPGGNRGWGAARVCSQAGFHVRCMSGGGRGRPRSRQTSWCRTSPFHGAPSTTAGRVYCPSPPWLLGLRLVTQDSHSTEHRVWGWERGRGRGKGRVKEGGKDSREEEGWVSGGKWKETGDWRDRVERKNSTRSLLLNTVEQYCNICSFQLQPTFINSIWLLSFFTPKVSKSIHSEGTVMVAIMSGCVWREICQNQEQLSVLSLVVSVFSRYCWLYLSFTDNHWQVVDKSTNL